MALKPNSLTVYNYVVEHDGEDFTASDIAAATGLSDKQVNGIVTRAFQMKEPSLMIREEAEIELEDGSHKKVKFIRLTDAGRNFDPKGE